MPTPPTASHGGGPRLAPQVRFTPLPFGGAVLVHASTLSVAECGEHEARVIERLLSHGLPGPDTGPAGEAVRRMSQELVAAGWLETAPAAVPAAHDSAPPAPSEPGAPKAGEPGAPPAGESAPPTAPDSAVRATDPSAITPADTTAPDTQRR
ncbi:actinodefensin-associated protein B [Streptomyces sp. NL15-2K]|nr:actinodefensin-associated protein B [Kutzneria buriramensis]WKX09218.1 actinodefensin-associated protein B [Kutzneria buriramensis]